MPRRTKKQKELQEDLEGCRRRLDQQMRINKETFMMKDATIARQRDWIVELERRLARALNEVAELRGEDEESVT